MAAGFEWSEADVAVGDAATRTWLTLPDGLVAFEPPLDAAKVCAEFLFRATPAAADMPVVAGLGGGFKRLLTSGSVGLAPVDFGCDRRTPLVVPAAAVLGT